MGKSKQKQVDNSEAINHHSKIPDGIVDTKKSELALHHFFGISLAPTSSPVSETEKPQNHSPTEESEHKDSLVLETILKYEPQKLEHPTRTRNRGPERRKPSNFRKDILEPVLKAIESYKNQESEGTTTSLLMGWLSNWRHGDYGKGRAEILENHIQDVSSMSDLIVLLDDVFADTKTRYNNHSLASYLLDALNRFLDNKHLPSVKLELGEQYSLASWVTIKEHLPQQLHGMPKTGTTPSI